MGYVFALIILPVFAILENSVFAGVRFLDGQPSLVLVAVIAWSWHSDLNEAIFWAFIGGLALDLLNPIAPAGISIIAPLIMVFAVKTIERLFYQVSIFALIAFVATGTVLHHFILYAAFTFQGIAVPLAEYVRDYSITSLSFNLIITLPVYWFLRRFQKRIPQRESPWAVTLR